MERLERLVGLTHPMTVGVTVETECRLRAASGKVARLLSPCSHPPSYQGYQPYQPPNKVYRNGERVGRRC